MKLVVKDTTFPYYENETKPDKANGDASITERRDNPLSNSHEEHFPTVSI